MVDDRHLKNREFAIPHFDAEWVHEAHQLSALLAFNIYFNGLPSRDSFYISLLNFTEIGHIITEISKLFIIVVFLMKCKKITK